jgi:prepilin-type N-terminal cleavage/methylation domain-containing protein
MISFHNKQKDFVRLNATNGFTLIELLVVISIIGFMSTLVISSVSNARTKAYDSRRIQDLRSISTAMRLHRENTGTSPANPNAPGSFISDTQANFLQDLVTAGILKTNPKAPINNATNPYRYYDYGAGTAAGMLLVTQLEAANPTSAPYAGSCRPFTGSGGQNWCRSDTATTYYCFCNPY